MGDCRGLQSAEHREVVNMWSSAAVERFAISLSMIVDAKGIL
jgi:hypothetical protein